ncbi:MAG: hypothetical protein QXS38_01410 [Candidatus Pacearchaeota archaeon]
MKKGKSLVEKEEERVKKELKWITGFDYPKLSLFLIAIIAAYFLFSNPKVADFVSNLREYGYLGVFIAGIFFTFGFTTPFAVGFFIVLNSSNIWLAAILGGLGAMLGDLSIFKFVRFSFMDEFKRLENTKIMRIASLLVDKTLGHKIKIYLMYAFAGIVIASPLPDEAGVTLLAGLTKIKTYALMIITFVLHTIGIIAFLAL